jgi:hypothetical protein
MRKLSLVAGILALPWCVACSGEDEAKPSADQGPLYVVSTVVSTEDTDVGYLVPVTSIGPGATFNLDNAIEVPPSLAYAKPGSSVLYTATQNDPTITRWQLDAKGKLASENDTIISFANLGISHAWPLEASQVYSDEKAYFTDDAAGRVVAWNPKTMEITGTIPLEIESEGALAPLLSLTVRQDRVFVVVSWEEDYEQGDWSRFGDHVRVYTIDPKTDEVIETSDEPRCNSLTWSFQQSDGTAYLSPMSWFAPIRSMLGPDHGVEPCGVRIVPRDSSFDRSYDVDLDALTGGRPTGNLFLVNDDVAFLRVWHEELVSPLDADKSNWEDVLGEAGFLWWKWELGSEAAKPIPDQAPGASEVSGLLEVDRKRYLPRIASDYSETTLDELDPAGALSPGLTGPGAIFSVVRLR